MSKLEWRDGTEEYSIEISTIKDTTYYIKTDQRQVDSEINGYLLYKVCDADFGYMANVDGKVKILFGPGAFSAIGAPSIAIHETVEGAKELALLDLEQNS